jgi:hypothetical protein
MKIDVLYFDDCPSWQVGLENLKAALLAAGQEAEIRLVEVAEPEDAARLQFLGSPSFQINGVDLWPEDRKTFDLSCRVYATPQGMRGAPSVEMLHQKLSAHLSEQTD